MIENENLSSRDQLLKQQIALFYDDYHRHRKRDADARMVEFYWRLFHGRVLEVGGGRRVPTIDQSAFSAYVTVDLSYEAIKDSKLRGLDGSVADGEGLPFADQLFDTVACCEVLEHVVNPDLLLREMCRTSGNLVIEMGPNYLGEEWMPGYDRYIPMRLLRFLRTKNRSPHRLVPHLEYDEEWGPDKDAVSACNAWWSAQLIQQSGFEIVTLDTWSFFNMPYFNRVPWLRYIGPYQIVVGRRK